MSHRRAALLTAALALTAAMTAPAAATPSDGLVNADFESCDTGGWTITGTAFSVTRETTWWGGAYDQHGACFLAGYLANQDTATGTAQTSTYPMVVSGLAGVIRSPAASTPATRLAGSADSRSPAAPASSSRANSGGSR